MAQRVLHQSISCSYFVLPLFKIVAAKKDAVNVKVVGIRTVGIWNFTLSALFLYLVYDLFDFFVFILDFSSPNQFLCNQSLNGQGRGWPSMHRVWSTRQIRLS